MSPTTTYATAAPTRMPGPAPTRGSGAAPTHEPVSETAAWTAEALRSVWERQRDRVNGLIGVIEQAVSALSRGSLDASLQADAERAAHMLAGSVGMFGFIDASVAARGLESELAHPTAERVPALLALLERLRHGVQGPVVLCSEVVA
jgi:HPt (histidine-containing phosphotransfer) domain-containing protein